MIGAAGVVAACAGPSAPTMPRPGPLTRAAASVANDACVSCHADVAATWRTSLHARSWTNAVFQGSFAKEPSAFCRDCHAPEHEARAIGVACVTCHDPNGSGSVLASPRGDGPDVRAPHRVLRDAAFATERACASCHDFAFPEAAARDHDGARMQRTTAEHHVSRFAERSCASCHMPVRAGGKREHGFAVASDPAMLRRALVARAARRDERAMLDLAPGEVGHAVPTGDLFRRLLVVAEVLGDDQRIVVHVERALSRHFRFEIAASGARVQRELSDDRVQGPQRVELDLGERARGREIAWRVEWQRVESIREEHAEIADTVILAEGRLPPGTIPLP